MIRRAKRALPGMVMSLLLSAPALAAPTHGENAAHSKVVSKVTHRAAAPEHHHVANARISRNVERVAAAKAGVSRPLTLRARRTVHASAHDMSPAVAHASAGHLIRRTSVGDGGIARMGGGLIDDGTMWREHGNVATWQQTGVASWYGGARWQGHRMSSGDRYDEHALTAAHATLPLGTRVKVSRNDGRRSVIVTITDRPGTRTRIIDLSRAAAKELGILDTGVAMVTLQPM